MTRALTDLSPTMMGFAQKFLDQCNADPVFTAVGANVFLTQTYRSYVDQNADFAKGRDLPGAIITNARGGQSPHNCTLGDGITPASEAFDFGVLLSDKECDWNPQDALWQRAIEIGRGLGLVAGADFHCMKDSPHMQNPAWNLANNK